MEAHSALVKEVADLMPVFIFTKEILDSDKPILVQNIPPLNFAGGPTNQGIIDNIQEAWVPDRSVAVVPSVVISVEEV